ncbi:hypothetical protein ATCCBAA256_34770 [Mycobacterium montefiorense]|nr:hypothetical protein ATCCBAA256_34770 [Mycobacterium montefiorense]
MRYQFGTFLYYDAPTFAEPVAALLISHSAKFARRAAAVAKRHRLLPGPAALTAHPQWPISVLTAVDVDVG